MKETRTQAMSYVYQDEGGYSNDPGDPGGPTNYGITIIDARKYWKPDATAQDVRNMPKSVAEDIYNKHYLSPLRYDDLPAGVDYAVLDYGINSGISRSAKVLQHIVGVNQDGVIGPNTLAAIHSSGRSSDYLVNRIYDERLAFLQSLHTWSIFGKGWGSRCTRGRKNALAMVNTKPTVTPIQPATQTTNWFIQLIKWILRIK